MFSHFSHVCYFKQDTCYMDYLILPLEKLKYYIVKNNQICLEAGGHKQFSVVLPGHGTQAE